MKLQKFYICLLFQLHKIKTLLIHRFLQLYSKIKREQKFVLKNDHKGKMRHKRIYITVLICLFSFSNLCAQTLLGNVQDNTNLALPSSYNFKEYVFAEPDDEGVCNGVINTTATIDGVFFGQTHRMSIDHPFYFLIGHRPALFQVSVLGAGTSPDVKVEAFMNGVSLGIKCLKGPSNLSQTIDASIPDFDNYFSVTLPKSWVQIGLSLKITIGSAVKDISSEQLKIGPYTELNLVEFEMDVLDYDLDERQLKTKSNNLLQEMASAYPASVVRYGKFPEKLVFPELIANNDSEQLVRLQSKKLMQLNGINSEGSINSVMALFMSDIQKSTRDYMSTFYFGNTLKLQPGGWGGGKSFVGFDYDDVFVHELGHAFSLPHWGDAYKKDNANKYDYLYPYGGDPTIGNGSGRGESWNFIQHTYEFISPTCAYDGRGVAGIERSDAMQRNNFCLEQRINGPAIWDGFGDFSAYAMHRYLIGAENIYTGAINYRNSSENFQFRIQEGFPTVSLENGKRVYKRAASQPQDSYQEKEFLFNQNEEVIEQDAYLIYGTAHPNQNQANIVYKPIKFKGTIPPIIDPTNPTTFSELKSNDLYRHLLGDPKDFTFKVIYENGEILHLISPHSYSIRPETNTVDYNIWRRDLLNFSVVVPATQKIIKVEIYKRPLIVGGVDDTIEGNINHYTDITAENFMDAAVFLTDWLLDRKASPYFVSIGGTVWDDANRNSIQDENEKPIKDVNVYLWGDSNNDGIPDNTGNGSNGVTKTNEKGEYFFTGLPEGKYQTFVWQVGNWDQGEPLFEHVISPIQGDANNDVDKDNNGAGDSGTDIRSGIVDLSLENEPVNDGDVNDGWFEIDNSSNRTIDFGFYNNTVLSVNTEILANTISVYPNPTNGQFEIALSTGKEEVVVELFTINSQRISKKTYKVKAGKLVMSLKNLPTAVYFIKVYLDKIETLKVIKQ